jgi:hypothetical protein
MLLLLKVPFNKTIIQPWAFIRDVKNILQIYTNNFGIIYMSSCCKKIQHSGNCDKMGIPITSPSSTNEKLENINIIYMYILSPKFCSSGFFESVSLYLDRILSNLMTSYVSLSKGSDVFFPLCVQLTQHVNIISLKNLLINLNLVERHNEGTLCF